MSIKRTLGSRAAGQGVVLVAPHGFKGKKDKLEVQVQIISSRAAQGVVRKPGGFCDVQLKGCESRPNFKLDQ